MPRIVAAFGLLVLASCSSIDRAYVSEFTPLSEDRFQFRAHETVIYTHDDRIAWMEDHLRRNAMCPDGYEIERQSRLDNPGTLVRELFIVGRCTG